MRLILSSRYPRNSTYSTETGHVLYKVNKPINDSIATIRKAVSTVNGVWQGDLQLEVPRRQSLRSDVAVAVEDWEDRDLGSYRSRESQDAQFADFVNLEENDHDSRLDHSFTSGSSASGEQFAFCSQVDFRLLSPTRFYYNGLNVPVTEYFRKEGWSTYGRWRFLLLLANTI